MKRVQHPRALADLADESLELAQSALEHMGLAQLEGLLQLLTQHAALDECQIRYRVLVDVLVEVLPAGELVLQQLDAGRRGAGVQVGPNEVQSDAQGLQLGHGIGGVVDAGIQQLHVQERLRTELGQESGRPLAHAVLAEVPVVDDASGYQLRLHIHAAVAEVAPAEGAHSGGGKRDQLYQVRAETWLQTH